MCLPVSFSVSLPLLSRQPPAMMMSRLTAVMLASRQLSLLGSVCLIRSLYPWAAVAAGTAVASAQSPQASTTAAAAAAAACRANGTMASAAGPCASSGFSITYVSINDSEKAESLARLLVEAKLAACIQIVPQITSIYMWQGKLEKEQELLMVIKSRDSKLADMSKVILAHHPYDTPEVVSVPVSVIAPSGSSLMAAAA